MPQLFGHAATLLGDSFAVSPALKSGPRSKVDSQFTRIFSDCCRSLLSDRIFVERLCSGGQLNPPVAATVVDGNFRRRKLRIRKRPHGHAD